jgi:hypothetical protein
MITLAWNLLTAKTAYLPSLEMMLMLILVTVVVPNQQSSEAEVIQMGTSREGRSTARGEF